MPYLLECNEWRLLQTLGLLIEQRRSHFDTNGLEGLDCLDSRSEELVAPSLAAELFEVETRHVFVPKDCSRTLSTAEFDEGQRKLKAVCELLDRIVHPRHRANQPPESLHGANQPPEDLAAYSHLGSLVSFLRRSGPAEPFDLATGLRPTLFKPPDDPAELKTTLAVITNYNNSIARLFASPAQEASFLPVSKEIRRKTWNDLRIRRRATSALGAVFGRLRCGTSHEVMLNVSDDADDGAPVPTLDLRLSSCMHSARGSGGGWLAVRCASLDAYVSDVRSSRHPLTRF
jgi:hypothetical protein